MESPVLLVRNLDMLIGPQAAIVEECKFCRRNFGTLSGKTRHEDKCLQNPAINKELRRLRFSCHKCGFNFSSKGSFNKHKAYCGVSQKCKICNKMYSSRNNLERHFRTVHCINRD